jgi:hypothetical protein
MERKAESILEGTVIYLVLLILFVVPVSVFVWSQYNGGAIWADFYAKEISRVVNLAEPGDEISIDVQVATEVAEKNEVKSFNEIFNFDNVKKEICVKLEPGRKSCFTYFNNVDVVEWEIKRGLARDEVNTLTFKIKESAK